MEKKELDRLLRAADIIDIQNIMGRYRDAPLTSFALDALPQYNFQFARKNLRENVRTFLLAYRAAHPGCTLQECKAECRRVFGWAPDFKKG